MVSMKPAMAVKQGIDVDRFTAALSFGGGQNAYFDERQMAIRNKDYATTFSVRNMSKDIDICRRLAKTEGVQAESLEGIREVYDRALDAGYGDKDYVLSLIWSLRKTMSNINLN